MRPQAHFSSEGFRRSVGGGGRNGFRPYAAEFRRSPAQIFIEVVCTEHIGRKTGCLPLKRGIGPGRLSVVAVRRGRLDEPCRAAAQRGIPCAGGPHLRAAGAPLDGRRRRGGDKETAPVLRRALGGIPVRPWGCRCVGGGVCYETVQEKNRGELGAAALRTGASFAFPVLDALAEGAEVLSGLGCRGGGLRPRCTRLRFGGCGRPGCAGRALRRSPANCSATGAADGRRPDRSHFFSGCGYLAESGEIRACAMRRHRPEWAEKRLSTSFLRSALGRGSNDCTNEEKLSAVCRTAPLRADSAAARRPRSVQCEAVFRAVSPGPISRSSA